MQTESKKNYDWINNQMIIIDKKQDFTKKGQFMSNNEKLKYEKKATDYRNSCGAEPRADSLPEWAEE